jgi:hypothetical protein
MRLMLAPLLALPVVATVGRADDTKLVTTRDGTTPLGGWPLDMSPDGLHVLFKSYSSDYVDDDTNGLEDLFVRDLDSGTVERVNVADDESESSFENLHFQFDGSVSADGRFVAFATEAKLDPADNSGKDVYLRDRFDGTTVLVAAIRPRISAPSGTPSSARHARRVVRRSPARSPISSAATATTVGTSSNGSARDRRNHDGVDRFDGQAAPCSPISGRRVSADGKTVAFPIWTHAPYTINTVVGDP